MLVGAMIDIHCHVLPGLDDGVRTLDEAVELALASEAEGITTIVATPHVREDFPTTTAQVSFGVGELTSALTTAECGVKVLPGGELSLEVAERLSDTELRSWGLGGSNTLLLEFPYYDWPLSLEPLIFELGIRGFTVVVAHPERNSVVAQTPERLRRVVRAGAYIQVTAASLDGRLGDRTQQAARELLALELAHVIASDAHHPQVRRTVLQSAAAAVGDAALARWLTNDVPSALVRNIDPPPRPARPAPNRRASRLFRR